MFSTVVYLGLPVAGKKSTLLYYLLEVYFVTRWSCFESGKSKGYGFVEFAHNKELSTQARNMLDGKRVGSCTLHCDFLATTIVSFDHLMSCCLYIDHLPPGYNNLQELRNRFSQHRSPTWFQVGHMHYLPFATLAWINH